MDQKEAKGAKKEKEGKTVAGKKEDDEEPDEASKFNSFQKVDCLLLLFHLSQPISVL